MQQEVMELANENHALAEKLQDSTAKVTNGLLILACRLDSSLELQKRIHANASRHCLAHDRDLQFHECSALV